MSTSELIALSSYSELVREYKVADASAKKVQSFRLEAGIPAINELRYAAHHIALALDEDNRDREQDLSKAVRHCQRAHYEALEAGNLAALSLIHAFAEDHRLVDVKSTLPDYPAILARVEELKMALMRPRATGIERTSDQDACWKAFDELTGISRMLDAARPMIMTAVRREQRTTRLQITAIALSALAIIVAITFGLLNLK